MDHVTVYSIAVTRCRETRQKVQRVVKCFDTPFAILQERRGPHPPFASWGASS